MTQLDNAQPGDLLIHSVLFRTGNRVSEET